MRDCTDKTNSNRIGGERRVASDPQAADTVTLRVELRLPCVPAPLMCCLPPRVLTLSACSRRPRHRRCAARIFPFHRRLRVRRGRRRSRPQRRPGPRDRAPTATAGPPLRRIDRQVARSWLHRDALGWVLRSETATVMNEFGSLWEGCGGASKAIGLDCRCADGQSEQPGEDEQTRTAEQRRYTAATSNHCCTAFAVSSEKKRKKKIQ